MCVLMHACVCVCMGACVCSWARVYVGARLSGLVCVHLCVWSRAPVCVAEQNSRYLYTHLCCLMLSTDARSFSLTTSMLFSKSGGHAHGAKICNAERVGRRQSTRILEHHGSANLICLAWLAGEDKKKVTEQVFGCADFVPGCMGIVRVDPVHVVRALGCGLVPWKTCTPKRMPAAAHISVTMHP